MPQKIDAASENVSYEFIRRQLKSINKFELKKNMLGLLAATQQVREMGRLHTYYPGQRTELDYTKFCLWLYPNENWDEPRLFQTGIGIDHFSGVIKGYTITTDPSARDAVRLYRNCVLPNSMWLPDNLKYLAHSWDVFGLEEVVALDNAMDLISDSAILMFVFYGVIVLRMPPKSGDLKGTVERTHHTIETQFASLQPGFVPSMALFNSTYTKTREAAKNKATLTVKEFENLLVPYIATDFNTQAHPRLKRPRINVWRDGQTNHPVLLPTGLTQIRSVFALTYEGVKLTREGVEVSSLKYNSSELHIAFRTNSGKVVVKLDPDDIRTVLVIVPNHQNPIEATITTFEWHEKITLELYRLVVARLAAQGANNLQNLDLQFAFPAELEKMQGRHSQTPGKSVTTDAQGAVHAAKMAPVATDPEFASKRNQRLEKLLRDTSLDDE